MIRLESIKKGNHHFLQEWMENDPLGQRELSFYLNFESWSKELNSQSRWGWLVYEGMYPFGFIDLEVMNKTIGSFAYYVAPSHRGQGKGKKLLNLLINKAKDLKIEKLQAGAEIENVASQKALESSGFSQIGKDGDDYINYELKL